MQDLIASQAREIYSKIVNQSGHMYVCGDVAMAAGVSDTLCRILQEKVSFTKTQAKEFIKKMKVRFDLIERRYSVSLLLCASHFAFQCIAG